MSGLLHALGEHTALTSPAPAFALAVRAFAHVPPQEHPALCRWFERLISSPFHDLHEKMQVVHAPELDMADRLYSLWMFYIMMVRVELRSALVWVGPELSGSGVEGLRIQSERIDAAYLDTLCDELRVVSSALQDDDASGGAADLEIVCEMNDVHEAVIFLPHAKAD